MRTLLSVALVGALGALVFAPVAMAADVQGKIKDVDATGRIVTLEDGTKLTIPNEVLVSRDILRPGAMVKASFEKKGAENVVKSIDVTPGK